MARKHPNPLDDPQATSSSGEEEDQPNNAKHEGSESEEEEEEEEEGDDNEDEDGDKEELKKEKSHAHQSQSKSVSKGPKFQEENEDTESDSDPRSPGLSGFTIRKRDSSASLKPKRIKPGKESLPPVLVSLKRSAEADLQKDSKSSAKKLKSENGGDEGASMEKKGAVIRVWDESSEIAILKGMIEFQEDRGVDPNADSIAFYEFIKDSLSVDVSKNQLMDKIRRLKKKYNDNVGKCKKGEDPVFSRPHELKCFELSKKFWGGDMQKKRSSKKKKPDTENAKPKANGNVEYAISFPKDESVVAPQGKVQEGDFSQLYPFLDLSLRTNKLVSSNGAEAMASCLKCLEKSTLEELEEEWRNQTLDEAAMCTRRTALLQKQIQLVSNWNAGKG